MRRGFGQFIRRGYGGAGTTAKRLGGAVRTAGALYSVLAGAGEPGGPKLDFKQLAGKSANEIIDAVIEACRPVDGTQDGEASRASISDALSELLTAHPDANLLDLSPDQRFLVMELYLASEIFCRFELDLGRTIREKAPTATAALARLKEVRDYIRETVAASFRTARNASKEINAATLSGFIAAALTDALRVFETYAQ